MLGREADCRVQVWAVRWEESVSSEDTLSCSEKTQCGQVWGGRSEPAPDSGSAKERGPRREEAPWSPPSSLPGHMVMLPSSPTSDPHACLSHPLLCHQADFY